VFAAFRNRHGRHASEADADVTVRLPIDHHIRGNIDVGAVKVFEFALPVFLFKRDEYGAQHALVVERCVRIGLHVRRCDGLSRGRGPRFAAAPESAGAAGSTESKSSSSDGPGIVSGRLALSGIEPSVIVLVELFDDLDVPRVWAARPPATTAETEWKVLTVGGRKRESLPLHGSDSARWNRSQNHGDHHCNELLLLHGSLLNSSKSS